MLLLAMDRAPTVRSYDADGRLHVARSNISKANVCPYLGREIPGWQELGLDAERVYQLLRDPAELAKAAATFNNLPVLSEHVPVTAFDEDSHMADLVVGSTGTDAEMDGAYLTNSMVIWARPSIRGVERDQKRQLSSAYRYRADMTPGNYEGVAYDGRMVDIVGNHVALVFEGRAGPDVIIGDEKPMALKSMRAVMLAGGLGSLIRPLLAQDAKFDLGTALADVSDKSLAASNGKTAVAERVFGLAQPHLAQDAKLEVADVQRVVDTVAGMALDGDDELPEPKKGKMAEDEDGKATKDDAPPAMDEAAINQRIEQAASAAVTAAQAGFAAVRAAEREVSAVMGELVAMDSAEDIYKAGLEHFKVDVSALPASAYGATFRALAAAKPAEPIIAQDSRPTAAAMKSFGERYPNRVAIIQG